jgi:hypothetical protein
MQQVPDKIFVVPGEGRKVPLPLPGGGFVPAAGAWVQKSMHVHRLIRSKDLVEAKPPEPPAPEVETPPETPAPDAPATKTLKG